jgi:hypothetical protein
MLAEVLLKRDPRSVTDISAPTLIAPTIVVAAVILSRSRQTLLPIVTNEIVFDYVTVRHILTLGRLRFVVFANRVELQWNTDITGANDASDWAVQSTWANDSYPES